MCANASLVFVWIDGQIVVPRIAGIVIIQSRAGRVDGSPVFRFIESEIEFTRAAVTIVLLRNSEFIGGCFWDNVAWSVSNLEKC